MAISTATFISDIVLFIRDIIRENLTDPKSRTSGFVNTAFPKRKTEYPLVTVRNTGIDTSKLGMQSELKWCIFTMEIRVYARNSKEVDEMTQEIIQILRTNQYGTSGTNEEKIYGFDITSIVPIIELEGDNTIHQRVITCEYKVVLS